MEINLSEILIKSRDEAVSATGKEAATAASRALGRLVKKPIAKIPDTLPAAPGAPPKKAAPSWFRYGLIALGALGVYKLVSSAGD